MRALLTGMSGAGKSTLVRELRRRGHAAYDADEDGFSERRADGRWGWRGDLAAALPAGHTDGPLFFAGCSEEQVALPFDYRAVLTVPRDVLVDRLRTRSGNEDGRDPGDPAHALAALEEVEPLLRRSADLVLTPRSRRA